MPSQNYFKKADMEAGERLPEILSRLENIPSEEKKAMDLGCGNGRDTLAMLANGWQVMAVDINPAALAFIDQQIDQKWKNNLVLVPGSFEQIIWWEGVMLVNASYSLPFCPPEAFPKVWTQLSQALKKGGIFYGHFFGVNEGWQSLLLHTSEEVEELFEAFKVELFIESEFDRVSMAGIHKHWHVFEILAVKNSSK